MNSLQTMVSPKERPYLGPELRPHFLLEEFGLKGTGVVAWKGPCDVKTDHLVDYEDKLQQDFIRSKRMIHFLGEFFGPSLEEIIWFQRVAVSTLGDLLRFRLGKQQWHLYRRGDDLMARHFGESNDDSGKLSVSIVTSSAVSQLFHLGINLDPAGAPVKAYGLQTQLQLDEAECDQLVTQFLHALQSEWTAMQWARSKVRPV